MRLEGMIGKRADAPYVSRRSPTWIKLKCTQRQEFVVGGWTDPQGSRTGIGSLLLGIHDEAGHLRFAGGVGSGFDQKTLAAVKQALAAIPADETPFFEKPREVRGHWVKPQLVAEVSFGEWTPGRPHPPLGLPRPARRQGRASDHARAAGDAGRGRGATARGREDGKAAQGRGEARRRQGARQRPPRKKSATPTPTIDGIRISHPDRVVDASTGITKLEVVNHYLDVARLILPHLVEAPGVAGARAERPGRPGAVPAPCRHLAHPRAASARPDVSPDHEPMIEIDSFAALIGAAQANVIEFHTWNATDRDLTRPDRILFDLDPGEGVAWRADAGRRQPDARAARAARPEELPEDERRQGPARRRADHAEGRLGHREGAREDDRRAHGARPFPSASSSRAARRTASARSSSTTCATPSARPPPAPGRRAPGPASACRCRASGTSSRELTSGAHWTIRNVHERIEEKSDAWRDYATTRQTTAKAKKAIGFAPVAA